MKFKQQAREDADAAVQAPLSLFVRLCETFFLLNARLQRQAESAAAELKQSQEQVKQLQGQVKALKLAAEGLVSKPTYQKSEVARATAVVRAARHQYPMCMQGCHVSVGSNRVPARCVMQAEKLQLQAAYDTTMKAYKQLQEANDHLSQATPMHPIRGTLRPEVANLAFNLAFLTSLHPLLAGALPREIPLYRARWVSGASEPARSRWKFPHAQAQVGRGCRRPASLRCACRSCRSFSCQFGL